MLVARTLAGVSVCLLTSGWLATPASGDVRPMRYVIKDANGTVLGPVVTSEHYHRATTHVAIDGVASFLPLTVEAPSSFLPDGVLYGGLGFVFFTDTDCTSPPYLVDGRGLDGTVVSVVNERVFVPSGGSPVPVVMNSVLRVQGCESDFPVNITALPADELAPLPFVRPFTVEPTPEGQMTFTTMPPCRLIDTREVGEQTTGQPLTNPGPHAFRVQGHCGVPVGARAVSAYLVVIDPTEAGDARLDPTDQPPGAEPTSTLNFPAGMTLANAGVVRLGVVADPSDSDLELRIAMVQAGTAHFALDITGWFE